MCVSTFHATISVVVCLYLFRACVCINPISRCCSYRCILIFQYHLQHSISDASIIFSDQAIIQSKNFLLKHHHINSCYLALFDRSNFCVRKVSNADKCFMGFIYYDTLCLKPTLIPHTELESIVDTIQDTLLNIQQLSCKNGGYLVSTSMC